MILPIILVTVLFLEEEPLLRIKRIPMTPLNHDFFSTRNCKICVPGFKTKTVNGRTLRLNELEKLKAQKRRHFTSVVIDGTF